jgi:hypothetical protein
MAKKTGAPLVARDDQGEARGDVFPASKQRPALLKLARALGASKGPKFLSRDIVNDCDRRGWGPFGDWALRGSNGYIYAVPLAHKHDAPVGYQLMLGCQSGRAWASAKSRLGFKVKNRTPTSVP